MQLRTLNSCYELRVIALYCMGFIKKQAYTHHSTEVFLCVY